MKNLVLSENSKTMSSVEIVKIINDMREDGATELQHKNFLAKVEKVLGDSSAKFLAVYKDQQDISRKCYNLPKREAHLMVMSESYKVQAAVYDKMTELETGAAIAATPKPQLQSVAKEYRGALALAKLVGYKDNQAHLAANKAVLKNIGFDVHSAMELVLIAPTQSRLLTPTDIGNQLGLSGMKINQLLKEHGYQTDRRDLKNNIIWTPTEKGSAFSSLIDTNKKHSIGTPVQQLKWFESIIKELEAQNEKI